MKKLIFILTAIFLTVAASWAFAFPPTPPFSGEVLTVTETGDALTVVNTAGAVVVSAQAFLEAIADSNLTSANLQTILTDESGTGPVMSKTAQFINATVASFGADDATPDVSAAATKVNNFYQTANANPTTITDFDDADDHSEFVNGSSFFILRVDDANTTIDFSANANIEGNGGVDFTGSATQIVYILFVFEDSRWNAVNMVTGMSTPTTLALSSIDMGGGTLEIPNSTSDLALTALGQVGYMDDDDQIVFHAGANGEVVGEAAISALQHVVWSGDPGAAYDEDTEAFLFTIGDDAPEGITIVQWKCSCDVNPDVEINADLRYADAWIGLANAADIDEIDTTDGASGEDTNASINGGAAVANGKVVYIGFDADPEGTCSQMVFELWYSVEED